MTTYKCEKCEDTGLIFHAALQALIKCECRRVRQCRQLLETFPRGVPYVTQGFQDLEPLKNSIHISASIRDGWGLIRGLLLLHLEEGLSVIHCTVKDLGDAFNHASKEDDPLGNMDAKIRNCPLLIVSLDSVVKSEAYNSMLHGYLMDRYRIEKPTWVLQSCPGVVVDHSVASILAQWPTYKPEGERVLVDEDTGESQEPQ